MPNLLYDYQQTKSVWPGEFQISIDLWAIPYVADFLIGTPVLARILWAQYSSRIMFTHTKGLQDATSNIIMSRE
jgi:hypothetical protein